ncbi:DUF1801 domain-containing protein [Erysipelothrix tonsillarum]|uniref:DUF1801 domain-containing protein n=1 Tax=Erysipelothrix tonsillarum TaxID=38402 RepID=UPI000366770A|nr:DUF1801 domain-containing protein [Erysipelothrix tonsillarum]
MDIQTYIAQGDAQFQDGYQKLLDVIKTALPKGFELTMQYKMPTFVVPLTLYPKGYLDNPKVPLPFISLGYQKNHISLYHLGIYALPELRAWFQDAYKREVNTKLNMGKSCIRFSKNTEIPYELIATLASRITPETWIEIYEAGKKNN